MPDGPYPSIVGICENQIIQKGKKYSTNCGGNVEEILEGSGNNYDPVIGGPVHVVGFVCTSCEKKYKDEGEFDSFVARGLHKMFKNAKRIEPISPERLAQLNAHIEKLKKRV